MIKLDFFYFGLIILGICCKLIGFCGLLVDQFLFDGCFCLYNPAGCCWNLLVILKKWLFWFLVVIGFHWCIHFLDCMMLVICFVDLDG